MTLSLLLALLVPGGLAALARAEPFAPDGASRFGRGKRNLGIAVGVGAGMRRIGEERDTDDARYVSVAPRLGIGLVDPLGGDAWYRGSFEVLAEGTFLFEFEPRSGWAAGGSLILRYDLLRFGRFVPFLDGGVGILNLDFDLDDQAEGLNFIIHTGLGTHLFLTERIAVTGEWRYQHISNARIHFPNRSINASAFILGASFFLD
jgi:opacity protein-like surface antigen